MTFCQTRFSIVFDNVNCSLSDPAGTRTQDPYIKSVLLYQLSYRIEILVLSLFLKECKNK